MTGSRHAAPDFTLRQLAHLSAIAEAGSFSAAALAIHVSASALAGSLDELERVLGTRLCVRRKSHGVSLTADGVRVLRDARAVLGGAQDLASTARGDVGPSLRGLLRIGCYRTLAPTVLPSLVRRMADQHPDLRLDVLEADGEELQARVESGDLDLAVMYDRDVTVDVHVERIFSLVPHVLLAASHPCAGQTGVQLADLVGDPLVLLDLPPSREHTLALFSDRGLVPRVRYRTTSYELTRALVGRDLGYAVLVQRTAVAATYEGLPVVVQELVPAARPVGVALLRARGRVDGRVAAATLHLQEQQPLERPVSPAPAGRRG